jgi:hypothetical protein
MVVALRREHPYDVFWMHGKPEEITRDTLFKGTALSAPVSNLLMIAGYLGERLVRQRLRPSGWDGLESPLLVTAIGLAAAMALLGLRPPGATTTQ